MLNNVNIIESNKKSVNLSWGIIVNRIFHISDLNIYEYWSYLILSADCFINHVLLTFTQDKMETLWTNISDLVYDMYQVAFTWLNILETYARKVKAAKGELKSAIRMVQESLNNQGKIWKRDGPVVLMILFNAI